MLLSDTGLLRLFKRPRPAAVAARPVRGFVEELTGTHVAGWMMDPAAPGARLPYEVVCLRTGRVLATGIADLYRHNLDWRGIGDAANGFHARLPPDPARAAHTIEVRPAGGFAPLPVAADCRPTFEPLLHVAMDIVDNCNLRCPFCLYDYANVRTTHFMTPETLASALRFLPYVRDGNFWFSCLHEPTLHPDLTDFIDTVPREYRKKLFYTSNLAKRMPDSYFEWLAQSGMFNINISIESRNPEIYERMRKGARHHIFMENWEKLLAAFARAPSPPKLRYITMAYKSNIDELPGLASYLLEERQAWQVEMRYTYDAPYIPAEFRAAEFLEDADWVRLRASLPPYPGDRLLLIAPSPATPAKPAIAPPPPPSGPAKCLEDYYLFGLSYDGTLRVRGIAADSRYSNAVEQELLITNLDKVESPESFFEMLNGRK